MSLAMWIAIIVSGVGGAAAVLYFVWPDVAGTKENKG